MPGDVLGVLNDRLKAACVSRCDCDAFVDAAEAQVEAPLVPLVPRALVQGPTSAAVCEGFAVTSDQSSGSGGRDFKTYAWHATAPNRGRIRIHPSRGLPSQAKPRGDSSGSRVARPGAPPRGPL